VKRTSIVLIGILLIAATLLSACTKAGGEKVTVVTDATFSPFEYTDDAGNIIGFDVDLMNEVAKKAGLTIEWVNIPFDSVLSGISLCQYDVAIAAISITDERKASMMFTDPYLTAGLIVVVNKENATVTSMADLKGLTVAAQLGTTGEIEAQKIENVTYKPYDSYDLAFLDLANGQVDAVVADNPVAVRYVNANSDKLKTVGEVFNSEQYGIAVCKDKTELLTKLNKALGEVIGAGYIDELVAKYMP